MHAGLRIGAAVGEDEDLVVAIGGIADGGQHHAAGADPGEDERGYAAVAQLLVEVGGGERADPGLADGNVARLGRHGVVDSGRRRVAMQGRGRRRDGRGQAGERNCRTERVVMSGRCDSGIAAASGAV